MKGGDGLAAVKIPGGELPWEIDIDFIFHPDVRKILLLIILKLFLKCDKVMSWSISGRGVI